MRAPISQADFGYVRALALRQAGLAIEDGKEYLVESRLGHLAREEDFPSLEALLGRVRDEENGALARRVVEALTTNETSFFRDRHPFDALSGIVLPELIAARARSRALTIWSAACSSGQEPYSLALLIREQFPALLGWNLRILGTDLSRSMVERARAGRYGHLEVGRGLPTPLLLRHFEREGTTWRLSSAPRAMVEFRELNLAAPWPPLPVMDVVLLRNVLIYLDPEIRLQVLRRTQQALRPGGYLFVGGAETALVPAEGFARVELGRTVGFRRPVTAKEAA